MILRDLLDLASKEKRKQERKKEHTMVFKFTLKELRNYKTGRGKAEIFGMTVALKDNQPDERLLSITEAERLRKLIEYLESLEGKDPFRSDTKQLLNTGRGKTSG